MKKIAICIAAASLLAASCSKQKSETVSPAVQLMNGTIPTGGVELTTQGFLKFKDLETYEQILSVLSGYTEDQLDNWEQGLEYISAYTAYNIAQVKMTLHEDPTTGEEQKPNIPGFKNSIVEDDLLLRIMDRNGMIQIGDLVFAAHMDDGFILETNVRNLSKEYKSLTQGKFVPALMNKFNGDPKIYLDLEYESVFELLDNTDTTGINPGNFTPMLFGKKDVTKGQQEFYLEDNLGGKDHFRLKMQNTYQTALFYYSLLSKNWVQVQNPLGIWNKLYDHSRMQYVNLSTDVVKYKSNKRNSSEVNKSQQYPTHTYMPPKQKLRIYEGGRGLDYFTFETTVRWKIGETTPTWQPNERVTLYKY